MSTNNILEIISIDHKKVENKNKQKKNVGSVTPQQYIINDPHFMEREGEIFIDKFL